MSETFKVLEVICPTCGKMKNINIPKAIFSQKKFGVVKIQVPVNAVCSEHQFLVFVDTKGIIRGYEKIDIQMVTTSSEVTKKAKMDTNLRNLIQIFGFYGTLSLIHAKIFNYPVYILKDKDFEHGLESLNHFCDMILPESLRGRKTIHFQYETNLDKLDVKNKMILVIDTHQHIFQTPWKGKLKFEEEIVKRALEIIDDKEQMKLLQQDILKFVNEVNQVAAILQRFDGVLEDELIKQISSAFKIKKVNKYRLNLIKEFIKRNISENLISKIKSR